MEQAICDKDAEDMLRHGGMKRRSRDVYSPDLIGIFENPANALGITASSRTSMSLNCTPDVTPPFSSTVI